MTDKNTGLCMVHYVVNEEDEQDLRDLLVERGLETESCERLSRVSIGDCERRIAETALIQVKSKQP